MKNVLITGASRGIGRSIARKLAEREDFRLILNYEKEEVLAQELLEEIRGKNRDAIKIQADVADFKAVEEMHKEIKESFGPVDILINNAGITSYKLFQDISPEEWKRVFDVNFHGAYHNIYFALPTMLQRHEGEIINISSVFGLVGGAMESHYSASKAALISLTKSLAKECSFSNIRINCVAPGAVDTDMLRNELSEEAIEHVIKETPLNRLGQAEDVANIVNFLLSEDCRFMTGQVISPDGGLFMG